MLNSGTKKHSFIKVHPYILLSMGNFLQVGCIMQNKRFHGIDLHKRYATINVRDSDGKEIQFITKCSDFNNTLILLTRMTQ